jgi:hypothetical protein
MLLDSSAYGVTGSEPEAVIHSSFGGKLQFDNE